MQTADVINFTSRRRETGGQRLSLTSAWPSKSSMFENLHLQNLFCSVKSVNPPSRSRGPIPEAKLFIMEVTLVQCHCPACLVNTITDEEGNMIPGTYVHPSTRRSHLAKTQAMINQEISLINSLETMDLHNSPKRPSAPARPNPEATVEPHVSTPARHNSIAVEQELKIESCKYWFFLIDYVCWLNPTSTAFVLFFIMWLHLVCGLSHEKCRQAIVYITYMIKYLDQFKRQKDFCDHIPKDLRTITKHLGLDLELEEFICCQKMLLALRNWRRSIWMLLSSGTWCWCLFRRSIFPSHHQRYWWRDKS